jgi:hypothetical protein
MRAHTLVPTLLLLLLASASVAAVADDRSGTFGVLFGTRMMDESDWEPIDDHTAYGITLSFNRGEWPVEIAFDLTRTEDDATADLGGGPIDVEGETTEVAVGVRKFWGQRWRPFIGGGLCMTRAEFEAGTQKDDDTAAGLWINAGIMWRATRHFSLGVDARVSRVSATIFNDDGEVGGDQIALVVGTGW